MQKGGQQLPMHRSRSVPVLNKEGSVKQMDSLGSVYRVVPTTPRVTEQTAAASAPVGTTCAGTYYVNWCLSQLILVFKLVFFGDILPPFDAYISI